MPFLRERERDKKKGRKPERKNLEKERDLNSIELVLRVTLFSGFLEFSDLGICEILQRVFVLFYHFLFNLYITVEVSNTEDRSLFIIKGQ